MTDIVHITAHVTPRLLYPSMLGQPGSARQDAPHCSQEHPLRTQGDAGLAQKIRDPVPAQTILQNGDAACDSDTSLGAFACGAAEHKVNTSLQEQREPSFLITGPPGPSASGNSCPA